MTTFALTHALKSIAVPAGRALWLYGDPAVATGDVYAPWYDVAHSRATKAIHFHADLQKLASQYDAVFLNSPKQQDEAEGLLALALQRSSGFVLAVAAKNAGGGRLAAMMEEYGIAFDSLSKDSCRVVWSFNAPQAKPEVMAKYLKNLEPRRIAMDGREWWTMPGLFGWNKIDVGSRLLLQHLPDDLQGHVADFGCGYGYIAAHLSERYPAISEIDAYDANANAVKVAKLNCGGMVNSMWMDVRAMPSHRLYDAVVMNPPFHNGKDEDISLGEDFIRTAWKSLKPGGRLFFVANQHLPYEKIVPSLVYVHEEQGFKIMTGRHS